MDSSPVIELVTRLGLATEMQVRALAGRVRRMARGLPAVDSLWVDALLQARWITSYQAAEINAGRGEGLIVGPYVLLTREDWPLFAAGYRAMHRETHEEVQLIVTEEAASRRDAGGRFDAIAGRHSDWDAPGLAAIRETGLDRGRRYVVTRSLSGRTAAQWIVHNGRFPAPAVEEIARQMAQSLTHLESHEGCHGDVSSHNLILSAQGDVILPAPGLRGLVRPEEGYARLDLRPEAYAFLAPERASQPGPPNAVADIYSCACVWWHLLTGRTPLAGGSSLAKLRAVEAAAIAEVRVWTPETPAHLADVLRACLKREPGARPQSMARLSAMLGPPTPTGRAALEHCLRGGATRITPLRRQTVQSRKMEQRGVWITLALLLLVVATTLAAVGWSLPRLTVGRVALQVPPEARPHRLEAVPATAIVGTPPATSGGREFVESGQSNRLIRCAEPNKIVAPTPHTSNSVRATVHVEPVDSNVVVLNETVAPLRLGLRRGQRVCAPPGKRVEVQVPACGWPVTAEGVRFENLDFVGSAGDPAASDAGALVRLEASRASFHGCTFRSADTGGPRPAAIVWNSATPDRATAPGLSSGRIDLVDCWFWGVDTAIDVQAQGARAIHVTNTLHSLGGPLVRSLRCPTAEEPLVLSLTRVTLRESGPLWQCDYRQMASRPGEVSVRAMQCVFQPAVQTPLILYRGADSPESAWSLFRWTGEGSILGPQTPTAGWAGHESPLRTLDDTTVAMAGLVRGEVEFAGPAAEDPQSGRAVQWQVPLRSSDAPGIDADRLPAPRTKAR